MAASWPVPWCQDTAAGARAAGHGHHDGVTYEGLTLHKPARWHVVWGKGLAGLMW